MKTNWLRRSILIAPLWFAFLITLAGLFTPGYSHASQAVSELGASGAACAWLVNLGGFLPLGTVLVALGFSMHRVPLPGISPRPAIAFLWFLQGIAIIAAGLFQCDPGGRRDTFEGLLHAIFGLAIFVLAILIPLIISSAGLGPSQHGFRVYSLLTGLLLAALLVMIPNGASPGLIALQHNLLGKTFAIWYRLMGLHQRVYMLVYFAWLGVFAQVFLREK